MKALQASPRLSYAPRWDTIAIRPPGNSEDANVIPDPAVTGSSRGRSTGRPTSMSTVSEGIRVCSEKAGPTGWRPWAPSAGKSAEKVESNTSAMAAIGESVTACTTVVTGGTSRTVTSV
ncbi:hypothetical protein ACFFX0_02325 [Citricoccus parietis]|uniref:Uncharacterized protein n=1 Tax=Citricoccus parietis TaxID=592307 RepID=A0ABV5FTV2_9MICC